MFGKPTLRPAKSSADPALASTNKSLQVHTDFLYEHEVAEEMAMGQAEAADAVAPSSDGGSGSSPLPSLRIQEDFEIHEDLCHTIVQKWGDELSIFLVAVAWAIGCQAEAVVHDCVSLVEMVEATPTPEDPDLSIACSVSYKLIFWDSPLKRGRWLNTLNSKRQRTGPILYMPKVMAKDVSLLFSAPDSVKGGQSMLSASCKVLLNRVPVEMVRPKYMQADLPRQLKDFLDLLDALRNCSASCLASQNASNIPGV